MLLCLLLKDDFDFYRVRQSALTHLGRGRPEEQTPTRGLEKKALVISRELLFHTRKKYPPAKKENLRKAVEAEREELLPVKNAQFHMEITEQTDTFSLVDLWGWDGGVLDEVRKSFRFDYVVPEDLLFRSEEPELVIFERDGLFHVVACGQQGWSGSSTLREVNAREVELFIRGLGRYGADLTRIRCLLDEPLFPEREIMGIAIEYADPSEYGTIFLNVQSLNVRDFKAPWSLELSDKVPVLARCVIYVLLAYALALYMSGRQYDNAIKDASAKLSTLRTKLSQATVKGKDETAVFLQEFQTKRQSLVRPVRVMDALAGRLPPETTVTRLNFGEKTLDMALTSKEPLRIMDVLSEGTDCVTAPSIKGAISVKQGSPITFNVSVELKPCQ